LLTQKAGDYDLWVIVSFQEGNNTPYLSQGEDITQVEIFRYENSPPPHRHLSYALHVKIQIKIISKLVTLINK